MDSYDLFGEDGGSSMLDGLTDFSGDNLDSGAPRDATGSYVAQQPPPQQQQQQQQQYGQQIPQESPLQKLASFGGDFGHMDPQQQQQNLYHQTHSGYNPASARPLAPSTGPSYQPHMRSHRPGGQFAPYPPENMYAMDRQQGNLQGWNGASGYPGNMRHYGGQVSQPQASYRQNVGYPQQQQQQQPEKMPQQYSNSQMMGYQQYPPSSHYSGSYDNYGRMSHHNSYQQNAPQSPQYPQTPQQSQYPAGAQQYGHMQSSQIMGYHQQNQHAGHGTRPSAVDVPGFPQKPLPPGLGGASPQYRAPFPQLSPQMSPRSQMSPRPQQPPPQQQMSPRPVMSPAKPSNLSPHPLTPKSTSSPAPAYGPQNTLQQLEQMVPPYQTRNQPQANPQSPALAQRVPLSPQSWTQPQPSTQQQSSNVEGQMQNNQENMPSFHPMSTTEEAIPTSTIEPAPSEKSKTNLGLEPHSSTLLDNNCASPSESGGPSSTVDSKISEPKSKQPLSSPLHSQGQLPNTSPLHQSHNSPHQSGQVSQGLSPHPSHASPHPSHTSPHPSHASPHPAPSHPSPHPSLSSPHLSPGQPLQSPHPTTSQAPQSTPVSQSGPPPQPKEQENKVDTASAHQMMSPAQHGMTSGHHGSQQSSTAQHQQSHQLNMAGSHGLTSSDQTNSQVLGSTNPAMASVLGNMNPHQNLPTHAMQGLGSHMSAHGQIGSHLNQHMNQQHLGPSQTHMSHMLGANQNPAGQMIPPNQQQGPHMGGHGMSHMGQSNRFGDYSNPQYQNTKLDEMMSVDGRQFGSQMDVGAMDHPSNRSGRMMNMTDQTLLGMGSQQNMDPSAMRMMAGRQQPNMYNASPNAMMSGGTMMGMGMSSSDMFSHQQEMAALQQQLQELYCMPPAPLHQEKMTQLEERLRTLQQHEAATQCQGGPLCVLPGPIFGASLIQGSPQVTSTTGRGRGRGRGPAKPRKTKKQKLAEQQQQQLMEQQQMLMHQQQYRQMGYQSKGMPHEMNPIMTGTMGTMPNMAMMNNMSGSLPPSMTGNPNLQSNPMQQNQNIPTGPNMHPGGITSGGTLMPPGGNIPAGMGSNPMMPSGPPNMPVNSNVVPNPNVPMNPNLGSNLNIPNNNPNMTTNPNLLHNSNLAPGIGLPGNPNMMSNPNMPPTSMPSNLNMQPSNANVPSSNMQNLPDLGHHNMQSQSLNIPPPVSSNSNHMQSQNQLLNQAQIQSQPDQNQNIPPGGNQNMQQNTQPVAPPPPPPPPQPQSMSQAPPQPPQQTTPYPSNEESLSPLRQQAQERTPSPEPPLVMDNVPEATTLNDTTSNSNPPTSTLTDVNTNSNHSQPEVNTTCDVDSSTNPEYDSANMNPYDFQPSFSDSPEKKTYGKESESIDPYLMTDESLGGDLIPKKIRKPRKPREPKTPKEPKIPKESKIRKPRTPKTPKASPNGTSEEKGKSPRKRKESRSPKTSQRRGPKKRKLDEMGAEDWEALEAEEKRFFSLEDMAKNSGEATENVEESVATETGESEKPLAEVAEEKETPPDMTPTVSTSDPLPQTVNAENPELVSNFTVETPKKRGRKKDNARPSFSNRGKGVFSVKRGRTGHGRKKRSLVEESEEEGLVTTPPPSPGDDAENSNKRRSARNTQRKKYCDDIMLAISDEESPKSPAPDAVQNKGVVRAGPLDPMIKPNFVYVNTTDEDSMVVQHILAVRRAKREVKIPIESSNENPENPSEETKKESQDENTESGDITKDEPEPKEEKETESETPPEVTEKKEESENMKADSTSEKDTDENKGGEFKTELIDVDEYYVKYRNFSYLHCEWKTEEELRRGDRRIFSKIKRFQQKMTNNVNIFEYVRIQLEDEPFNPDFIEIDRVLDVAEHTDPGTNVTVKHYLVKWRSMQYDDSTWELEADVDPLAIKQFERFRKIPPKDKCKIKRRPNPEQWRKLEKSPVYKNNNTLRPYQLEGLNWLLFSWHNGRNCILADEMGLGKTIQSLAFVSSVYQYGIRGPFLVIAPLSTIPNWQREFEAWTDLNVVVYHGSAASLQMIQEYEFYFKNDKGAVMKDMHRFNVLITTFELIITHSQELKGFNWRICVIDEAHRLKNRNCKLLEGLRLLNMEHRVLLSGTPLQNNVNELFSLLNFLEPSQFSSGEAFLQEFGALKTESEVNKLQAILKPMMLRRMKEDVEKSLAPKEETVVEVELTNIQKKYYRGILERNFSFLSKGTTSSNIPNLMNTMMELRKCCIHPYLLNGAEEQIQLDYRNVNGDDPEAYYKALINSSGKMVLVDKLLPKLKSNGHRVLIFSQMVKCLDILEDYLIYRKYPFERIDGRIRGDLRQAAIDRYCRPDSDRFVFLLCTKAGGLGINLTAADTVIIYDSDWNPQNDLQAQARCHRIGQQKMVKVYRLICRNTYEREMFDKASLKLGLDKAVLQSMNTSQGGKDAPQKQLSKKEIEDLLKRGAYGAIMDEDSAGDKFCEEDIDLILERRTQVITLESEKGSTFSKASFASSGIRSDINIDDPDFWKKWAKKADIDTTEKDENEQLVVSEPRRRTQIKRYGQDDAALDMSDLGESSGPSIESDDDTSLGVGRGRGKKSKFKKRKRMNQQNHSPLGDDYGIRDGGDIQYGTWSRSECFKVEKGLLTFGWDRWPEIMYNTQFRKGWRMQTVEDCARVILVYCLRYYRGDEKIRNFIWDLITPCENGSTKIGKNHHGLSAPVPRGRNLTRSKNKNKDRRGGYESDHWSNCEKYDGEAILESNYKKHLSRHANKVLLRVRLLYYIKHEIIGDLVVQINEGIHASALPIHPPVCDQAPTLWWDSDADRSLLVGTFKHGYECYSLMRNDPLLCFLARVGPDQPGQERIMSLDDDADKDTEEDTMEGDSSNAIGSALNVNEENSNTGGDNSMTTGDNPSTPDTTVETIESTMESSSTAAAENDEIKTDGKYDWPTIGDLNTRLRRIITAYQKNFRKEEIRQLQKARKIERREKIEQIVREREKIRLEISQRKWSRREEVDFYRTVSVFGVEYDKGRKQYDWAKFKSLSRLEKKTDESMTEYYNAFYTMLKRSCGLKISDEEEMQDVIVEPLNEEKARKTLEVIEILSKVREEILPHPRLEQRLKLCKTSVDVPDWWVPGKHDKDLLIGVAKHGVGRTDFYLLNDPELCFKDVLKMSLVDDPASFLREKFAESFKAECNLRAEAEERQAKKTIKNETENEVEKKPEELPEAKVKGTEPEEEVETTVQNEKFPKEKEKEEVKPPEEAASKNKCPAEDDDISDDEAAESTLSVRKPKDKVRNGKKKLKQKRLRPPKSKFPISTGSNPENADPELGLESVGNVNEEDGDGDDEEEYDDDDDDEDDDEEGEGDEKAVDESVYDFEEEAESKNEKLKHDRPTRKEKTEKSEETNEENSKDKEQASQNESSSKVMKEEKPESDEEKPKEKEQKNEKCNSVEEKQNLTTEIKQENEKTLDNVTGGIKSKHFPFKKQIKEDDIKSVFPELDVIQPWARFHDFDPFLWRERCSPAPSEPSFAQLIAHSYQNPIKWPRDHAILVRLQHIIHAVEYKEWPVSSNFSAYAGNSLPIHNLDLDISARNTPEVASKRDSSTPMSMSEGSEVITITTDHVMKHHVKKKKHHIAIDVETERAKLHALLNCTALGQQGQNQSLKPLSMWETADESLSEDSRRSTPVSLQPPPAHQQASRTFTGMSSNLSLPFDLSKFHSSSQKGSSASGSSNTLAPMDLSKTESFPAKDNEAQDLSIVQDLSAKPKQTSTPQKGKLENTLDKLLKRKNCPPEEPIVDKEKKRRKLDAIVLGLSAAKEQQSNTLFGDSKKGSSISPSVTVTPANMHPPSSNTPSSKPFTITVTSVPTTSTSNEQDRKKDNFSSFLSQAEQQHGKLLLKQQQHLLQQQQNLLQQQALSSLSSPTSRKSYEAMVADLSKVADFSKLGSYTHDAKASGSKAPSLKRLAQWLMENPMYDVDPKWAELVKERGNLGHDMQKRLPTVDRKNKSSSRPQVVSNSPESVSSSSASVSQANLATSIASNLSFPSLATAGLGGLPAAGLTPGLLSSLSLGNFDPKNPLFDVKNNPLFDPKTNPFLDPKNHPLFDPKNLSLLDPKNPLFDPKNALFDPKNNPFFDPKNNPLLDAKNNPLFDAKNNPLLLSFGGLPNMGALGGMGPLSNSMNFFANLATLGLPSLSSLDPTAAAAAAAAASTSSSSTTLPSDQASPGSSSGKNKSRKTGEGERHNSKASPVSSASSTVPNSVAGGLPFYFPNPSLLYSPLNLGALNPFTLPPGALSSAYDSLAQQCGLLNGSLGASSSGSQSSRNNGTHRSQPSVSGSKTGTSTSLTSSHGSGRHHRPGRDSIDRHSLQHLLLPHDTSFLESLGRVSSGDSGLRGNEKRSKEGDRKESSDKQEKRSRDGDGKSSSVMDFSLASGRADDRPSKRSKSDFDSKKDASATQSLLMGSLAEMDERMLRRLRESDMKEALEVLSRSHAELFAKSMAQSSKHGADLSSNLNMADFISRTMEEHNKKPKEAVMKEALALSGTSMTEVKAKTENQERKVESETSTKSETLEAVSKKRAKISKKEDKKPEEIISEGGVEANVSNLNVSVSTNSNANANANTNGNSNANATANANSNSNASGNANANANSNSNSNANSNANANVSANASANANTNTNSNATTTTTTNANANANIDAEDPAPLPSAPKAEGGGEGKSEDGGETAECLQTGEQAEPAKASGRCRRGRNVKRGRSKSDTEEPPVVERKNLRSSAGRAARAAAERAAMKELNKSNSEKSEDEEDHNKTNDTRDDS